LSADSKDEDEFENDQNRERSRLFSAAGKSQATVKEVASRVFAARPLPPTRQEVCNFLQAASGQQTTVKPQSKDCDEESIRSGR